MVDASYIYKKNSDPIAFLEAAATANKDQKFKARRKDDGIEIYARTFHTGFRGQAVKLWEFVSGKAHDRRILVREVIEDVIRQCRIQRGYDMSQAIQDRLLSNVIDKDITGADIQVLLKAHSKLFGSRKYRDVTVGDMQDLVRTIKDNVKLQPDGVGAAAFSRDQWSRIVEATRVIVKESIAGAQETSAMEKVRTHLRGHLPGWMANRLIAVLNKLASCSSFFKNPGLHAAVLLVSVFGIGASAGVGIAVVTAVTSLGLYAAFHVYQAARQTPEMQEANFVQNLANAWGNEFNEGRIHQPGDCNWNLMLLSNGERFISDILSSVYNHGQRTNRDELRSYFRLAFRQAADDCRPVKLIHRESRVADLKLELGRTKYREGKKYVEDAGHRTVDGVLWRTFSRETTKDRKIVVREFIALSNDPIELRLQNNRVWDRISFL